MKLVFSDFPVVDEITFRRLLLLGDDISLVNQPCIHNDDNDIICSGVSTYLTTETVKFYNDNSISLSVVEPPSDFFHSTFYKDYFTKDLQNSKFIDIVINQIESGSFNYLPVIPDIINNSRELKKIQKFIITNREKLKSFDYDKVKKSYRLKISNDDDAIYTFWKLLYERSIKVSSIIFASEKSGGAPVTINPYLNELISQRLSNVIYTGKSVQCRQLGIRLFESMIPDEALTHLTIEDIILFKERTIKFRQAWEIEINKLEVELLGQSIDFDIRQIQQIIDREINPKLLIYKQEIRRIRDDLFAKVLKLIKNAGISIIAGGTLSSINLSAAIACFILTNLKSPQISDEIIDAYYKLKDIKQSNGLTYIMKINQLIND